MKTCSKCKKEPALSYHAYCYTCLRIASGDPPVPKFRRDPKNKTKCSRCKVNDRLSYHRYCAECKRASHREWAQRKGGYWKALTPENKKRGTVRAYINNRLRRGKVERLPCAVCGSEETEFHHLDYLPRTLNVLHLCAKHHDELEALKKKGLTDSAAVEYLVAQLRKQL